MTFANAALLAGLVALAIPPIIHLLNRRKFDVVDWAAMQFLQISQRTRRKVFLEELLLMLLRMLVLGIIVLAIAAPRTEWDLFASLRNRPKRDIVVIFDGSLSMGYTVNGKSSLDLAKDWAKRFLNELQVGDAVGVLNARQQPTYVVPLLTTDFSTVRSSIDNLPKPRGGANWPESIQQAMTMLQSSPKVREIILLTDGQKHGWADEKTLVRWELLSKGITLEEKSPQIWVVNVAGKKLEEVSNWSLSPIQASRPVAPVGREVRFKSELQLHRWQKENKDNASPSVPDKIKIEVDGRPAGEIKPFIPTEGRGRIPFSFTQRFSTPGSHLISLRIDDDALPGDNRQDISIDVIPSVPLLIVDGDPNPGTKKGTDFLRDALAPAKDLNPAFLLKIVPINDFAPDLLTKPISREANSVPRALVLSNCASLKPEQIRAIELFLTDGGGVLVTLGSRIDAKFYNENLYREGKGWLPARLLEPVGDENVIDKAPQVVPQSLEHPALELFKDPEPGTLTSAYFPRYWKVETPPNASSTAIALLNNRLPFFTEKSYGKGRVVLSVVPLNSAWRTNLTDLGDFVRLSHEMMYYLAGTRGAEKNLESRQAIVFTPLNGEPPGLVTIDLPEGIPQKVRPDKWPLFYDETREVGVYKLTTELGKTYYYVVQPDASESILTPWTEEDQKGVTSFLPNLKYIQDVPELTEQWVGGREDTELWWLFLLLVIGLLLTEIYFTRRIAIRNPPVE